MKKVLLGFALSFLTIVSVLAQTKTITGRVTSSEEPEGVPGASVVVKGTTQGTVTNLDGSYSITVSSDANVLVFSFVGYLTKEVTVGSSTVINVQLDPDVKLLNEVVVTGYGTQERREITGSVASINNGAIENLVAPSFDSQLAGRAAGVSVTVPPQVS